ncbi:pentatricopeptide repeat-containing protein at1g62680 mitochondrial [Phtheirospermum japonicum]|uniref:Pentatricopeptide repeat-containing protein at1g62680 mitochondrial n=1 Tax=Phtheirospermum japonicum TaxID=374723 RepID=A0A830D331_9LAMI|nr:pentatricopeptide repeat-containing protein at1g62680 mitochondrial [Phtheirospermum japonicum]
MLMFREIPRRGLQPNIVTYNTILQGLFRGGRCSEALEIFDELQAVGLKPDFYTYCNMLDGLCRNGQVERALLLLDELEHKERALVKKSNAFNLLSLTRAQSCTHAHTQGGIICFSLIQLKDYYYDMLPFKCVCYFLNL